MRRRFILLGIDLFWVALSPFAALIIRDNFDPRIEALSAVVEYAALGLLTAALVLPLAGVNRSIWRYASLPDMLRIVVAVTAIVLLSLLATFTLSRLEGIARSLPVIQWFVLLSSMVASRLAIRIFRERQTTAKDVSEIGEPQNILLVGVNQVAELYLRAVAEFAPRRIRVLGILAPGRELPGRTLRLHKVQA